VRPLFDYSFIRVIDEMLETMWGDKPEVDEPDEFFAVEDASDFYEEEEN